MNKQIKQIKQTKQTENNVVDEFVIDYKGDQQLRKECVKISNVYYKLGNYKVKNSGDCYEINGVKYRITSNKIIWNQSDRQYQLISEINYANQKIIVSANNLKDYSLFNNDDLDIGEDVLIPVTGVDNNVLMLHIGESQLLKSNVLKYDFSTGYAKPLIEFTKGEALLELKHLPRKPYYNTLPTEIYSMSDYPADVINAIEKQMKKYSAFNSRRKIDSLVDDFTYGFEIETDYGYFPEQMYYKYGAIPLKDGSIKGSEITTLVLSNKTTGGLTDYLMKFTRDLKRYTRCTKNNSLHINIGNFKNNSLNRVALYELYYRLEREIECFIPSYKRSLNYLVNKQGGAKDHCKLLTGLVPKFWSHSNNITNFENYVENYDKVLFQMLNSGVPESGEYNRKTRKHIQHNSPKWEHWARYYTLNLENLYFGKEAHSRVEFRVHSGTINPIKTYMWFIITSAITKYAITFAENILKDKNKVTLEDVLHWFLSPIDTNNVLFECVKAYIEKRTSENTIRLMNHNDSCDEEFSLDHTWSFNQWEVFIKKINE